MIPGSIRQALDLTIRAATGVTAGTVTLRSGYWATFMHGLSQRYGQSAELVEEGDDSRLPEYGLVQAVHVETEFGIITDVTALLQGAREVGALTVIDAACSTPIDPFDLADCDIGVLGSHKCLGGPPGLGILVIKQAILATLQSSPGAGWSLNAYIDDSLAKHRFLLGEANRPFDKPPLVTYPMQIVNALRHALLDRVAAGIAAETHANSAARLREGFVESGFSVPKGRLSNAVLRFDVPSGIDAEALRRELLARGYFVIGGIGTSGAGAIRIGCMSIPQLNLDNIEKFVAVVSDVCGSGAARSKSAVG